MALPTTLVGRTNVSYVNTANAVASEPTATPNHVQRVNIARYMAMNLPPPFGNYIVTDFQAQGYDDTTLQAVLDTRMSALLTNLVVLGFGN